MDQDNNSIDKATIITNLIRQTDLAREYVTYVVDHTSVPFLQALTRMDEHAWGAVHQSLRQDANTSAAMYNLFTCVTYKPGMTSQNIIDSARNGVRSQLQKQSHQCNKDAAQIEKGIDYRSRMRAKGILKKL